MNAESKRLTSPEITSLCAQYQQDTLAACVAKHVLATVTDAEIRSLFAFSLELSKKHIKLLTAIFHAEHFPLPNGFTDEDVDLHAPPLFTDSFWLKYLHDMTIHGLSGYGISFSVSVRRDLRDYYHQCNLDAMEIYNRSLDLLLAKNLYVPAPYFLNPKKQEPITDLSYALDFVGKQRLLNTTEAGNIYFNLRKSMATKALLITFKQVSKRKDVRKVMETGLDVAHKHIELYSSIMHEENLHTPPLLDNEITTSTHAPFSEKLMTFHAGAMFKVAITYYATAMTTSMRLDIVGHCEACILRDLKVAGRCSEVMIKNGWIEKPPEASDRKQM